MAKINSQITHKGNSLTIIWEVGGKHGINSLFNLRKVKKKEGGYHYVSHVKKIDSFRNIKSIASARAIISRRNKDRIRKAIYNDSLGNSTVII